MVWVSHNYYQINMHKFLILGYKTCALTNNWNDGKLDLSSMLSSYFDLVIESSKAGIRKPSHAIYELACQKLEVLPSEVIIK